MSGDQANQERRLARRVAERLLLDRDELIALVEELYDVVRNHQGVTEVEQLTNAALESHFGSNASASKRISGPGSIVNLADDEIGFTIVFDGGAIGNPGKGYGSYVIYFGNALIAEQKLTYGNYITNNQAEFMTLIHALRDLIERTGQDSADLRITIYGDSQLVINTVRGAWKVRHPRLKPLHDEAVTLLREFKSADIKWQPRSESVRILGH